jgi:molybdopterin-binding protein
LVSSRSTDSIRTDGAASLRIGQAAKILGVSIETFRRWGADGTIQMERSSSGQRLVAIAEVTRLLDERRQSKVDPPTVAQAARNRFLGVITGIERDGVVAVVEVAAGPHRLVSMLTARALIDHGLKVGDKVVCAVKATDVMVDVPTANETSK